MLNFSDVINREYGSAYINAYILPLKKQFSTPKIYTAKGDLKKRWYVYFYYRSPETGKMKLQTPFYGTAHNYKTKEERLAVLTVYREIILKLLKEGFSPYEDNTERFHSRLKDEEKAKNPAEPKVVIPPSIPGSEESKTEQEEPKGMKLAEALELDRSIKDRSLRPSSKRSYFSHINVFSKWIKKNRQDIKYIDQVDKRTVIDFLNDILKGSKPRNRNNYRASLSSLLQNLVDNDVLEKNIVKEIKVLDTTPTRNKSYSRAEHEAIFEHLEKEDPMLLLFIKFVSYNFLRPVEVCRLKVGDINLKERTLTVLAKNSPLKTKIIPKLLFDALPDLSGLDKDLYLFTPKGLLGKWSIKDDNKRDYFSKRFNKKVKKPFGLGEEYGLYSFRHTFISKLYRSMVEESSPYIAKGELMQITGHSSMRALESYLRDIDAKLPSDYSERLIS